MKKLFITTILLLSLFSCSKDDEQDDSSTDNSFTINYSIDVSHAEDGTMTIKSINDDVTNTESSYSGLSDDETTIIYSVDVNADEIVGAKVEMYDETFGIRGYISIEVLDSNNEVVASIEAKYLNTDSPPISSSLTFTYNIDSGESELTGDSYL